MLSRTPAEPRRAMGVRAVLALALLMLTALVAGRELWRHSRGSAREDRMLWFLHPRPARGAGTRHSPAPAPPAALPPSVDGDGVPGPAPVATPPIPRRPLRRAPGRYAPGPASAHAAAQPAGPKGAPAQDAMQAEQQAHRRHHHWEYLGVDRLWHWIRRGRPEGSPAAGASPPNH